MKTGLNMRLQPKHVVLALMCLSQVAVAMAGYNYSPILSVLLKEWSLSAADAGMIASASQAGYVATVIPCGFLSDKFNIKTIYVIGAVEAVIASIAFCIWGNSFASAVFLRFLVGLGTGAINVPGIKLLTNWFDSKERGRAIGIYTSCIAIAQATPLLIMAPITISYGWRWAIFFTSVWGVIGSILVYFFVKEKPQVVAQTTLPDKKLPPINTWSVIRTEFTKKHVLLINLGYIGHMWEYIAFNAWVGPFTVAVMLANGFQSNTALVWGNVMAATAFFAEAISVGLGGFLSDRIGRTKTTMIVLIISAICSFSIGWLINSHILGIVIMVVFVTGFFVIMDSAVFKAGLSEIVAPGHSGAILGIQSFLGFGIGVLSPTVFGWVLGITNPGQTGSVNYQVWGWAFSVLGIGALVGMVSMWFLRRCKEAALMAEGKK